MRCSKYASTEPSGRAAMMTFPENGTLPTNNQKLLLETDVRAVEPDAMTTPHTPPTRVC